MVTRLTETEGEEWLRGRSDRVSIVLSHRDEGVLEGARFAEPEEFGAAMEVYARPPLGRKESRWLCWAFSRFEVRPAEAKPVGHTDGEWLVVEVPEGAA